MCCGVGKKRGAEGAERMAEPGGVAGGGDAGGLFGTGADAVADDFGGIGGGGGGAGALLPVAIAALVEENWADKSSWAAMLNGLGEAAKNTRALILGLVIVEFSVALLVATNTSAAAVTKERESQTLDFAVGDADHVAVLHLGEVAGAGEFHVAVCGGADADDFADGAVRPGGGDAFCGFGEAGD